MRLTLDLFIAVLLAVFLTAFSADLCDGIFNIQQYQNQVECTLLCAVIQFETAKLSGHTHEKFH
jgi:hypothetical protein